jgi:hypothetical protein
MEQEHSDHILVMGTKNFLGHSLLQLAVCTLAACVAEDIPCVELDTAVAWRTLSCTSHWNTET